MKKVNKFNVSPEEKGSEFSDIMFTILNVKKIY